MVSICTGHRANLLYVVSDTETLASETIFCYVTAPSYCVTVVYSVVDDLADVFHRNVVTQRPAPVILYLNSKLAPHWVVGVAGNGYIIIKIQTEALAEALWSILLALVCKLLRSLTDVRVDDALKTALPGWRKLLSCALCYCLYVWSHYVEELTEVSQRVTCQ